jgi:hypothetical protein
VRVPSFLEPCGESGADQFVSFCCEPCEPKTHRTAAVLGTYFDMFYGPPTEDEEDEDGGQGFSAIGAFACCGLDR